MTTMEQRQLVWVVVGIAALVIMARAREIVRMRGGRPERGPGPEAWLSWLNAEQPVVSGADAIFQRGRPL